MGVYKHKYSPPSGCHQAVHQGSSHNSGWRCQLSSPVQSGWSRPEFLSSLPPLSAWLWLACAQLVSADWKRNARYSARYTITLHVIIQNTYTIGSNFLATHFSWNFVARVSMASFTSLSVYRQMSTGLGAENVEHNIVCWLLSRLVVTVSDSEWETCLPFFILANMAIRFLLHWFGLVKVDFVIGPKDELRFGGGSPGLGPWRWLWSLNGGGCCVGLLIFPVQSITSWHPALFPGWHCFLRFRPLFRPLPMKDPNQPP